MPSKRLNTLNLGNVSWMRCFTLKVSPAPVQLTFTFTGKEAPNTKSKTSMVAVRVAAVNLLSI